MTVNFENHSVDVDLWYGPAGSCGFRSGTWHARVDGVDVHFFASVPHCLTLDEQERRLASLAVAASKRVSGGEVMA